MGSELAIENSFFNQLNGNSALVRDWIFCYWNPSSFNDTRYKRYAQNDSYKLYDSSYNNNFFKISTDKAETFPLASSSLSAAEINIKTNLQQVLDSLKN